MTPSAKRSGWNRGPAEAATAHAPAAHIGGFFDIFAQGALDALTQLEERGGEGAKGRQKVVMGPWVHASIAQDSAVAGELTFPENAKPSLSPRADLSGRGPPAGPSGAGSSGTRPRPCGST